MEKDVIKAINKTLDKIRPFINRDGGDIEFVRFEEGIVYVKFLGACQNCSAVQDTLGNGVEVILMEDVPEVVAVRMVD
jgi:Fe-S cluster biogenesis protein NfuA